MSTTITSAGNAGFHVASGFSDIFVDAFYGSIPGIANGSALRCGCVGKADVILVTHDHWDHFNAEEVADVARRTGASVVGPRPVASALRGIMPGGALFELEPSCAPGGEEAAAAGIELSAARITAFRTRHSKHHNSYLVEAKGFRFFHDGDNEDTAPINVRALGRLDALLIGPWRGSGWVEFIEKLNPPRYFLMHLTNEELDEHEAGRFLPEICDRVPPGLVALRPGRSFVVERNG